LSSKVTYREEKEERSSRPESFKEFFGQKKVIEKLKVFIKAAKLRKETLDHVLLSGPPGLGKTTLAYIISKEIGTGIRVVSGPSLERAGDLAAILTNLRSGEILFIDEIHRVPVAVEEILYSAMEDFKIDIVMGKGPGARTITIPISRFTLIGATTLEGKVSKPLRNRFGVLLRLDYYQPEELVKIITHNAKKLGFKIQEEAAYKLALSSRGTPRIAIRLLKRIRDFASVKGSKKITMDVVIEGLHSLDIDSEGLDFIDRKILITMIEEFNGGPVSLDTIAAIIGEDSDTIYDVYEPFLIKKGFLRRTPKGRKVMKKAYLHLGYNLIEEDEQAKLF